MYQCNYIKHPPIKNCIFIEHKKLRVVLGFKSRRSKLLSADWPLDIVWFSFFLADNGDSNVHVYQFSHGLVKWIGSYSFIFTIIEFQKPWNYSLYLEFSLLGFGTMSKHQKSMSIINERIIFSVYVIWWTILSTSLNEFLARQLNSVIFLLFENKLKIN